ncbi:MAG TPA: hypothetical protein VHA52_05585 [Candidatus Babeliaceae bacterium]|nr:hypothetical protein [Candidatus Babeliaceae bacterium]
MGNKLVFIALFILMAIGCATTKRVSFNTRDNTGRTFEYQMRIPKGYIVKNYSFENEGAKILIYPDSSRLYFSDNTKPSAFYPDAYKKYGEYINIRFLTADTITIDGVDEVGKYWKTRKARIVVYGYMKVPIEKKKMFDRIINNVSVK